MPIVRDGNAPQFAELAARSLRPRRGKRVTMWEEAVSIEGIQWPVRRVLRLIERTIDGRGQHLIQPEFQLDGWTTSLSADAFDGQAIMALYADRGTHEQFHSEFKTDLDLERLPSGKFDTNYVVCGLAAPTMDILRLMGQAGLHGPDAPVRHEAKRRRLKTVMQELVYRAGRLIEHGRRLILGLGANDRAAKAFTRLHGQLFAACGQRRTRRPACCSSRIPKTRMQRDSAIRPLELAHWRGGLKLDATSRIGMLNVDQAGLEVTDTD